MPIKLPSDLPAFDVLTREGVMVMPEDAAARQDIRPLRIALLNLMPKKITTETQFARLIGATPLQIDLSLLRMSEHQTRNTAEEHMDAFYRTFAEVEAAGEKFDGMIITGAPIEHLDFDQVTYWDELTHIFDWTQRNVHSTFGVCWGGMAMINHFHGVPKHMLEKKAFGCPRHRCVAEASPYLRGFSDDMVMPVSRWTEVRREDIEAAGLPILIDSAVSGPALVEDPCHRALYIFNHLEYDNGTLKEEYDRDVAAGKPIEVPANYYPDDDPTKMPQNRWRSQAHLLYGNWINEIYQTTPFDMDRIGVDKTDWRTRPVA
ncbi:MAG: homoserine O-succinyltransferase [Rhodobacteraceae bacterium]|jgi:homoserine O-succinyltransferase|uniref:Homoserine O-acetyltransferase n=1 Tax=Salipiger profundus TaxID=1229727 RepID=A0A1U7D9K5_9RHOB|nr:MULTISPECIES: homoserine O-succinyltransferase [Salipiger]APX24813.1 homoserine O-succinyltransferase [Salipiger profundus]MAB07731.1 homoserine O-succinyltransferase [Paracoccaceae bacterium]GFZ97999.1 homoserine O-succinyltransferase [Salipiger profundus]SFC98446.1 homoserine O-succinyltransferase [Salipiger profundus]